MKRTTIVGAVCGVLSLTMSGVAAPPEYQQAVLDSGPLLYYQLNEDAGDAVNSGSLGPKYDGAYNGAITRGVSTASGDTGVTFNGPADFIQSGALAPAEVIGNPAFSAETVVRIPAGATALNYPPFLHWGGAATGLSVYFSLHFNNNNRVYAGFYNAGLRARARSPTTSGCTSSWSVRQAATASREPPCTSTVSRSRWRAIPFSVATALSPT